MSAPRPHAVLLRHGETEWSKSGQHTGSTDIPLTERGVEQARAAAKVMGSYQFSLVLVSPMQRARVTAELAGLTSAAPCEVTNDLLEWDYGEYEGITSAEIHKTVPGWTIWDGPWPGGETPADVAARTDRVVARVRAEPPGSTVALVAHGHILRVLAARWLETEVAAGRWLALETATVSELGWEHETPVVQRWNIRPE